MLHSRRPLDGSLLTEDHQDEYGRPGPGSVTWRVNGERLAVLGWGRAILLQLAHPLVAAGVDEHSTFRGGPFATVVRFHGTLRAMLALTFGTDEEAGDTIARIRGIHDRVHGTLSSGTARYDAGAQYSAHDPALLAWVNLTLLESVPLAYRRFAGPLDDEAIGGYCRESRWAAVRLGVAASSLPRTRAELESQIAGELTSGRLEVTDAARRLAHAVLTPPLGHLGWPVAEVHRLASIGDLPPAIREGYGLSWTARDQAALDRWSERLRWFSRRAPEAVRRWRAARRPGFGDNRLAWS